MRFFIAFLLALSVSGYWPAANGVFAQEIICTERQDCEQKLAEIEKQIAQQEVLLADIGSQKKTLKKEVDSLNAKINKLNLQIKAINLTLVKLDKEIVVNKGEISDAENRLEINKTALTKLIQKIYEDERRSLVEILLKAPRFSDFFGNLNNILSIQDALSLTVQKISELRGDLLEKKENLSLKRSDAAALKTAQDVQRAAADRAKQEKNSLLAQTKGQESKFQSILKETRKSAAEIRKRIFQFFGGGEMSFEEAYQLARLASQATGVRAAFILAILDKESALGQNVGRCSYETAMHPTRDAPVFLALVASLKEVGSAPPEPILVSCANRDGAYGGAMGPAQFIPSTWKLYANRIAELTGHNPASPWNNGDAIMGTALYIKDAVIACDNIYNKQLDIERCAAARYYSGGRWRNHLWGYGDRVVTKAQQFQSDINILNS